MPLLVLRKELGTFDRHVWGFHDKDALSKDLKERGFRFVGPTIVESFMQAVGIRNDHERGCYRRAEPTRARAGGPARERIATTKNGRARGGGREGRREGGGV